MLRETNGQQLKYELVMIDNLVPENHLLRKIDKVIDFSFINEICKPYYCVDNGRPAIEPETLFKMLFIGYLYGIRSERRLVEEVRVNVAYRWFLGYALEDKIPDASVIWQNRIRRFNGTDIPQQIFDNIVRQAMSYGLVGGKVLYSDSTHLKASANKNKFVYIYPERNYLEYTTTNRQGYKEYKCKNGRCMNCPSRELCLSAKAKTLIRHVWEDYKDEFYTFTHTEIGKKIYSRRKGTVERSFADSKELFGLRYCIMRGLSKVAEQCLLTAAAQNMKKIAMCCG